MRRGMGRASKERYLTSTAGPANTAACTGAALAHRAIEVPGTGIADQPTSTAKAVDAALRCAVPGYSAGGSVRQSATWGTLAGRTQPALTIRARLATTVGRQLDVANRHCRSLGRS